jgi:hypothetical protein
MRPKHTGVLIFLSALALGLSTGCATATKAPDKAVSGQSPEIGISTSVTVGETMVSNYDYIAEESAVLVETAEGNSLMGRPTLTTGATLTKLNSSSGDIYCVPMRGKISPCFKDDDADGDFDSAYNYSNVSTMIAPIGGVEQVKYRVRETTIKAGFKNELVYQGAHDGSLRLTYREYSDSLARPDFNQDLMYSLSDGDTDISFRNVRLTVHSATNNQVTFTVQSNFE